MRARQPISRSRACRRDGGATQHELFLKNSASLWPLIGNLAASEGAGAVRAFADAIERGEIGTSTPIGSLQRRLGVRHGRLQRYRDVLSASRDVSELVAGLRGAAAAAASSEVNASSIEIAWTFPGRSSPRLRTTGGVAREIIEQSKTTLLIVGFAVTVDANAVGLAAQTVEAVAHAAERGVLVTAVLHRSVNLSVLTRAWRRGVPGPAVLTWPARADEKASVHAKLILADRRDALVTSANLTYHGFEGNLEMGVRIAGSSATIVHDQVQELINLRELVPWPG